MANILNIQSLRTSNGTNVLTAAYGNSFYTYDSSLDSWTSAGVPITSAVNRWRSTVFVDKAFYVNGYTVVSAGTITPNDDPKRYDGTTWSNEYHSKKMPLARYIHTIGEVSRVFIANLYYKAEAKAYPNRVWFCDLPKAGDITWGFEEGTNMSGTLGSTQVSVPAGNIRFKSRGIKIGDALTLPNDTTRKEYNVAEVITETQLILTEPLESTLSNVTFWVGSNYFDVVPDDGDEIFGLGDNNGLLLIFKRNSLWKYDRTSLRKIKGVPGTTSQESVVNIGPYTYYFADNGIWRTDGVGAEMISRPIQDYIDGISSDNFDKIQAWVTGSSLETLRVFVGDVANTDEGLIVTNCILDFDTAAEKWAPGRLADTIVARTEAIEGNERTVYIGNDAEKIHIDNMGNTDDGVPIEWMVDTGVHFPATPEVIAEISKILVFVKHGRAMSIRYKLYGIPFKTQKEWVGSLGDITDDVTEFMISGQPGKENTARGVGFQMTESGNEKGPSVERIVVFYRPSTLRSL